MPLLGYTAAEPVVACHEYITCCTAMKQETTIRLDRNAWDASLMGWGTAGAVVEGAGALGTVANHVPCPES